MDHHVTRDACRCRAVPSFLGLFWFLLENAFGCCSRHHGSTWCATCLFAKDRSAALFFSPKRALQQQQQSRSEHKHISISGRPARPEGSPPPTCCCHARSHPREVPQNYLLLYFYSVNQVQPPYSPRTLLPAPAPKGPGALRFEHGRL